MFEIFAYSFVQSDGFGFTLAGRRWSDKYWNPINSYGYRDYEPEWRDKIAFVVGDSFVAGHGIKKIDNRFSNILANKLGNIWTVTTLAQVGWNTKDYFDALTKHNRKPDTIIISYFINDIENATSRCIKMPSLRNNPSNFIAPLVKYTYLGNWAYWRIYRGDLGATTYWSHLKRLYDNDDVWNVHLLELDALVNYAKKIDAKIGFIVWPNLLDVRGSKDITNKVSNYLNSKGVMVFDLTKHYKNRDSNDLTANSMDAHPNEAVNAEVSQLLYQTSALWD